MCSRAPLLKEYARQSPARALHPLTRKLSSFPARVKDSRGWHTSELGSGLSSLFSRPVLDYDWCGHAAQCICSRVAPRPTDTQGAAAKCRRRTAVGELSEPLNR